MRLIDVDTLKINLYHNKKVVLNDDLVKCIDDTKTAYSVDKVVEELDKASDYYECEEQGREHVQTLDLTDAIEIVKDGGVSDDVCEWHCDMYGRYHTECHILADNDPLEYTYCPYCGKKIKVVE